MGEKGLEVEIIWFRDICGYLGDGVEAVADAAGYGRHDEPVSPVSSGWPDGLGKSVSVSDFASWGGFFPLTLVVAGIWCTVHNRLHILWVVLMFVGLDNCIDSEEGEVVRL